MKKKGIIFCLFTVFLCVLSGCNETREHEVMIPSKGPEASMDTRECDGYETINGAYCGYEEEVFLYDNAWTKEKLRYDGDFAYLNFDVFNGFDKEQFVFMQSLPVTRQEDCALKMKNSDELLGYTSEEWCVCEVLKDEPRDYDIKKAIDAIEIESDFRLINYPKGNPSDMGIAYRNTLFYEAVTSGKQIYSIPSCYQDLQFVGLGDFHQNKSQLLRKMVRNGERNMWLELFVSETEECYFLSVSLDGISAYGYILKEE